MIYEVRTYDLKPGNLAEVEKRFGEAVKKRVNLSPLAAFFHTEIGPLNQIVHIWPYENLEERSRIRAQATKEGGWPPPIGEFILNMKSEIMNTYDFFPTMRTGKVGPIFEYRSYKLEPGEVNRIPSQWAPALEGRQTLSPLVAVWHTEFGALNQFVHIWAYESLNHRMEVRAEAAAKKLWPPPGSGPRLTMENKILLPASFSPLQ